MKCKKCRKLIPDGSKFCNHCGAPQIVKKLYRRPDGLYEKSITVDGRRKVFRGKTEKEVFRKIADYDFHQTTGPLFSDLVDDWEENYCSTLAASTVHGYQTAKNKALDYFKGAYVKDIQTADVRQYAESLPLSYSEHTISNYVNVLSSIMAYAVRSKNYPVNINPCNNARIHLGTEAVERRVVTDGEMRIILQNVDKPFGLFPLLLLFTGCRRGEALALDWRDIDMKSDTISVNKSLSWKHCRPFIKTPKTKKGRRSIVLLPELKQHLKPKRGIIFPNGSGDYMTENQYEKAWSRYLRESGLEAYGAKHNLTKLTAHCLRHGYATILYEANVDTKQAQRLLGHAKEATTRDIYTHITERSKEKNTKRLKLYVNKTFNNQTKKSS